MTSQLSLMDLLQIKFIREQIIEQLEQKDIISLLSTCSQIRNCIIPYLKYFTLYISDKPKDKSALFKFLTPIPKLKKLTMEYDNFETNPILKMLYENYTRLLKN